ncbi:MAG: hypothetical protein AABN33_21990 [Acidobacteriota bacterium]
MTTKKSKEQIRRHSTAAKLAALTIANAFIFQAELSEVNSKVHKLRRVLAEPDLINALAKHWTFICDEINYVPIFSLAKSVILELPERAEVKDSLRELGAKVLKIVEERAALRHDLMGRVYHRLLQEAKYLGTFYTSVPSATLLLKLTLDPSRWNIDWKDLKAMQEFRGADLACGTGTLLMAAQQAITDNFIRAVTSNRRAVNAEDLRKLHRTLIESTLYGYDVLASAVHLTASTLALLAPEIVFDTMHLHCVPLGEQENKEIRLGSIDFLQKTSLSTQMDLMGGTSAMAATVGGAGTRESTAPLPYLDLCAMNPPFTRSVGGNLLFGSLPKEQRKKMQGALRKLLAYGTHRREAVYASSTAGLGSVFVAVADPYIKPGGRIALVLPAAVGFGVAWEKTRKLLASGYEGEFIIASHDPERWSFSENCDIGEILFVARKRSSKTVARKTICVNLWRNTKTPVDALGLADEILKSTPANVEGTGSASFGICSIHDGTQKRGEIVEVSWDSLKYGQWHPVSFAQTDLVRVGHFLRQSRLFVPTLGVVKDLPMVPLSSIADLGPDRRDIYDGYLVGQSITPYPAFWGHQADQVLTLEAEPNAYLAPRTKPMRGRKLRKVDLLWPKAGRIMIAERMRFNTQRLSAVRLPVPSLSNVWWPVRITPENEDAEKILVVWLNSTLGIVTMCSFRVPTEGSWVQFKKPILEMIPVLDITRLSQKQCELLTSVFDRMRNSPLLPLPEMTKDPARIALDDAISAALEIPDLSGLRELLAKEPVISDVALY